MKKTNNYSLEEKLKLISDIHAGIKSYKNLRDPRVYFIRKDPSNATLYMVARNDKNSIKKIDLSQILKMSIIQHDMVVLLQDCSEVVAPLVRSSRALIVITSCAQTGVHLMNLKNSHKT